MTRQSATKAKRTSPSPPETPELPKRSRVKERVTVIGAGIGGLSAAAQLAYRGYDVTVIEKNAKAGGKIIQFERNGFTFDGGASFITLSMIYRDWFTSLGKNMEDYITMTKMQNTTTFHFHNGKTFTLSTDPDLVRAEIRRVFPGDEDGFDRFMRVGADTHEVLYQGPKFARRNYHKLGGFDFIFDKNILSYVPKVHIHETWKGIVDRCFKSPELRAVFSYQATFMGMNPRTAPGTYAFLPWCEINDGMFQVKGGVYGIVKGFERVCRELGVDFVFDTEVTGLEYTDSRITGLETTGGRIDTDIVVSNADGAWFYTHLMPPEKNTRYTDLQLRKMRHTNSYFTINLGLKKPIPNIEHHTFHVGKNFQDYFDLAFEQGSAPKMTFDNTCYYMLQQSALQPEMAPEGKAVLFILVPVCGYDPMFDWDAYEDTFKNFIYDMIEQRDGIRIRDLIEEEIVYGPTRWGREFNLWENIVLSFSLDFFQVNGFRMPNKSREFENLYFVGSSTIPGPGLPPCITSGELVTERILEDAGRTV